jgi:50S ribosomal protein L16 3-hydroxylase
MHPLGDLSHEEFLKQYWQKKPVLIRQAMPDYESPLSAEELAGLACEEDVESRLIQEKGGEKPWQLLHGPFIESDFTSLPDDYWTLLVQSVDYHVPELAVLLDEFNFIPTWRLDDLMISFAQDKGSVGPHLDNYDVFLLQVEGKRHWHISEENYSDADLMKGTKLKILSNFNSQQDWILEPGDMLYLPPGVAHHGVAVGDCVTFSIGFRAPTRKELLTAYSDESNESIADTFYTDPDLTLQKSSGEIRKEHIDKIQSLMRLSNVDKKEFSRWFGSYITEKDNNLEFDNESISENEFADRFEEVGGLTRNGNIRLSYIDNGDSIGLFVSGEEFKLSNSYLALVSYLCAYHFIEFNRLSDMCDEKAAIDLLFKLYDDNYFFFDE